MAVNPEKRYHYDQFRFLYLRKQNEGWLLFQADRRRLCLLCAQYIAERRRQPGGPPKESASRDHIHDGKVKKAARDFRVGSFSTEGATLARQFIVRFVPKADLAG